MAFDSGVLHPKRVSTLAWMEWGWGMVLCLFEAPGSFCLKQMLFFQKEKFVNIGRC